MGLNLMDVIMTKVLASLALIILIYTPLTLPPPVIALLHFNFALHLQG